MKKFMKKSIKTRSTRDEPVEVVSGQYTLQAEFFNTLTHAIGLGLALAGSFLIVFLAARSGDIWKITGVLVFGISMSFLYLASSLYHGVQNERLKLFLKKVDHSAIYIFIAGTYTPFVLVWIRNPLGVAILTLVWLCALAGVVIKFYFVSKSKILTVAPYALMGWASIFLIKSFYDSAPFLCLLLTTLGGIVYSLGALVYIRKNTYSHSIWHLFVLLGSLFHFNSALFYVAMA